MSKLENLNIDMDKKWYYWVIKNVENPTKKISGKKFQLSYLLNGKTVYFAEKDINFSIFDAPIFINIENIKVLKLKKDGTLNTPILNNFNIKEEAQYEFTLKRQFNDPT